MSMPRIYVAMRRTGCTTCVTEVTAHEDLEDAGLKKSWASLLAHLAPQWIWYSVHMRRTQRYCLLLIAIFTSASVQEPQPAVCQSLDTYVDITAIFRAFWGVVLTTPMIFGMFLLFNKALERGTHQQLHLPVCLVQARSTCSSVPACVIRPCVSLCVPANQTRGHGICRCGK